MSLKLRFAVSFIDIFITIQYAVFRKSISMFYVSLYIYITHHYIYVYIFIYQQKCVCFGIKPLSSGKHYLTVNC